MAGGMDWIATDWIAMDWIAIDWGTSRLRVWAMDRSGAVLTHAASDRGMGTLAPEEFEGALLELIAPWLTDRPTPALICGMAGAREGWREASYRDAPCAPVSGGGLTRVPTSDPRLDAYIVPGLRQMDPPDVMRGEETQLAGLLRADPGFDGVVCLPGTHSKWVEIRGGAVIRFQTFLTGELFDLLAARSILRHTVGGDGWNDAAFVDAAREAVASPGQAIAHLFGLRAGYLLHGLGAAAARARLSGLLIGAELGAARSYWSGHVAHLVGAGPLVTSYADALEAAGCATMRHDAQTLTLAGLFQARLSLEDLT